MASEYGLICLSAPAVAKAVLHNVYLAYVGKSLYFQVKQWNTVGLYFKTAEFLNHLSNLPENGTKRCRLRFLFGELKLILNMAYNLLQY